MTRLPLVSAREMESLLERLGFTPARKKGSHVFYRHPDGRTTTLPHHGGRVLGRPLLREILREIELSPEEYLRMLGKD